MNIRLSVILGVIVVVLLGWFYTLNEERDDLQHLIKKPDSPEYIGTQMETVVFSPEGKKQYSAQAAKVEYYETDGRAEFTAPVVYLFDLPLDNGTSPEAQEAQNWRLVADYAKLTREKMLQLNGHVVATSLDPSSRLQRVETDAALVNLTTQDITSDHAAKIIGQNFNSTGQKLVGNLKQQIATLKEQVKTIYEINKQ